MNTFEKITWARKVLNISDEATIFEIRGSYLKLLKKYHPDKCTQDREWCEQKTKEIISAYNLLMDYCGNYLISFKEKDIEKYLKDEEWWIHRFGEDPLWGKGKDSF